MRVGFYDPFLTHIGGGEKYLLTILETAVRDGHQVTLMGPDSTVDPASWERVAVHVSASDFTYHQVSQLSVTPRTRGLDVFVSLANYMPPLSLARRSVTVLQFPFRSLAERGFAGKLIDRARMRTQDTWVVYSSFVEEYMEPRLGIRDAVVIPPPVDVDRGALGAKGPSIIAVGRFFPSLGSNNKKHGLMVDAFRALAADGWTLHLVGGAADLDEVRDYVAALRSQASGIAVEFHVNASSDELDSLYRGASLFWHAAGHGETRPERMEHFGITTAEAMAYGCVPVVPALGGQLEIVTDGADGRLWKTEAELVSITRELIADDAQRERLAAAAVPSVQKFAKDEFVRRVRAEVLAPG